jgi:tetratricopeptide (TPR) repeat protein
VRQSGTGPQSRGPRGPRRDDQPGAPRGRFERPPSRSGGGSRWDDGGPRSRGGPDRHPRTSNWADTGDRGGRPAYARRDASFRDERSGQSDLDLRLDIPDTITADQLDPEVLAELRTLPGDLAEVVARLLVATSVTEDPDVAFRYAKKARGLAARVGVVRETCAIAAYQAGDWSAALAEFRAARRLTGRNSYLPLMADCERALGRLDRALELVTGPDANSVDRKTRIELHIVESGIRRDQGLPDAAVVALQVPELTDRRIRPEFARLYYAYADALMAAGREAEAHEWFGRAARADVDEETDAAERYEDLDDVRFDDLDDDLEGDEREGDESQGDGDGGGESQGGGEGGRGEDGEGSAG